MDPRTNCPNCGAPRQRDTNTGAFACRHCGTIEEQPVIVGDLEIGLESLQLCPVCLTSLSHVQLDGNAFHVS